MRAILFARATRTNIGGLRVSKPPSQVPGLAAAWTCRLMMTLLAPMMSNRLRDRSPILVVAPSRCLPPVECCCGTRPSVTPKACFQHDAAKSRALRKVSGGGARTAMAVAINGPMPGTVISRRATSFSLARRAISAFSFPISASRWASARTSTFKVAIASAGMPLSGSSTTAISFDVLAAPCGTIWPNSVRRPRVTPKACFQHDALIACVRCRISNSRTRKTIAAPWVSSLFTGTKRMIGRTHLRLQTIPRIV